MGLTQAEHWLHYLVMGTVEGMLDEEVAAEGLDEIEVAEADVATGPKFLQLLYMRSDQRADSG